MELKTYGQKHHAVSDNLWIKLMRGDVESRSPSSNQFTISNTFRELPSKEIYISSDESKAGISSSVTVSNEGFALFCSPLREFNKAGNKTKENHSQKKTFQFYERKIRGKENVISKKRQSKTKKRKKYKQKKTTSNNTGSEKDGDFCDALDFIGVEEHKLVIRDDSGLQYKFETIILSDTDDDMQRIGEVVDEYITSKTDEVSFIKTYSQQNEVHIPIDKQSNIESCELFPFVSSLSAEVDASHVTENREVYKCLLTSHEAVKPHNHSDMESEFYSSKALFESPMSKFSLNCGESQPYCSTPLNKVLYAKLSSVPKSLPSSIEISKISTQKFPATFEHSRIDNKCLYQSSTSYRKSLVNHFNVNSAAVNIRQVDHHEGNVLSCFCTSCVEKSLASCPQRSMRHELPFKCSKIVFTSCSDLSVQLLPSECSHIPSSSVLIGANSSDPAVAVDDVNIMISSTLLSEFAGVTNFQVTPRQNVLMICSQNEIIPFHKDRDWANFSAKKIGEGSYGEVFSIKEKKRRRIVVKLIPIEGEFISQSAEFKSFEEVFSEIMITKRLSEMKDSRYNMTQNFVKLNSCKCLQGKYPAKLVEAQSEFYGESDGSTAASTEYPNDQLFIALEFDHGGTPLEFMNLENPFEAQSIFIQVACTLAIAEEQYAFEHRDLHLENIMISRTAKRNIPYIFRGVEFHIPTYGVLVTIIDFTLSRLSDAEGVTIFADLALDKSLFSQKGDYQFSIYPMMKKNVRNNWRLFVPYSNILWLHYLLKKLCAIEYKLARGKRREALQQMRVFEKNVLEYESALAFVKKFHIGNFHSDDNLSP